MFNYLAFNFAGIESSEVEPDGDATSDGTRLARECIEQVRELDPIRFPPKLLVLLASPVYIESGRAQQLVDGVLNEFVSRGYSEIQLIGCTVAAVFFKRKVHAKGALLVCLSSRLIDVTVASSFITNNQPEESAKELLRQLNLDSETGVDPNPFANRTLFTFLPSNKEEGYVATKLHDSLRERLWARVPIIGGISSGFNGKRFPSGLQFANSKVHKNLLVAACLTTRTLLGMTVNDKLERTSDTLQITALSDDKRIVTEFDHKPALGVIKDLLKKYKFVVLGKRTFSGEPVIEMPLPIEKPPGVRLLREANESDTFRVLIVDPSKLTAGTSNTVARACQSIGLNNAVGCLGFRCSGYFASRLAIGLNLEEEIIQVEEKLGIMNNYVGGFVDGEAGKDVLGRSQIRSWSTAVVIFGDELRHRNSFHEAFNRLADFLSQYPSQTEPPESSVEALLNMVYKIGFPGVRLLLAVDDHAGRGLVAPDYSYALGSLALPTTSFPYCIKIGTDNAPSDEPAAVVERAKKARFFPYTEAKSSAVSYYAAPLKTIKHTIMAVLQIDVGKTENLGDVEDQLLTRLSIVVGASLTRIFTWQENRIRNKLQEALKDSLPATETADGVQRYLTGAVQALGLRMGHIRQADLDAFNLRLYAGLGAYYEAALEARPTIDFGDLSPTTKAYSTKDRVSTIINDARNDPDHLRLVDQSADLRTPAGRALRHALDGVGSYANLRFSSERGGEAGTEPGMEGTINLLSEDPWFFRRPQKKVLTTIAEHIRFLIDHMEQKIAEKKALDEARRAREEAQQARDEAEEARAKEERARELAEQARKREQETNKRLEFLLKVSPALARQDLDKFAETLKDVLDRFCQTVRAKVGSLYLWDVDRELYVLRAQYRWADEERWIDTATYSKEAGWFGARGLEGGPRLIPDLFRYYDEKYHAPEDCSVPGGLYAEHMFGQKLSPNFTVEVLGLPLSIGQKELGVLALYRPISKGQPSGFLETAVELARTRESRKVLAEAASDVSGLIAALLQHQDDVTERDEQKRRILISDSLFAHIERGATESFEKLICSSVAEAYGALRVDLYQVTRSDNAIKPEGGKWTTPLSLSATAGGVLNNEPDAFLETALTDYAAHTLPPDISDIKVKRATLNSPRTDPLQAAREGLVERACLPLFLGQNFIWILDLHWQVIAPQSYSAGVHLRDKYLWQLSDDLSKFTRLAIQTKEKIKAQEEAGRLLETQKELLETQQGLLKTQQGLLGKVGVVAQLAHSWRDQIPELLLAATALKKISDVQELERAVDDHLEQLSALNSEVWELLELTEKVTLQPLRLNLRGLIPVGENEVKIYSKRFHTKYVPVEINIDEDIEVFVTPLTMKFAFQNIIDNAIKYTQRTENPRLVISARQVGDRVFVRFENNGTQIDEKTRDDVNNNRYEKFGVKWGLMIAKCFAQHDGGDLRIETPEKSTALILVLPKP